ncbi:conserved Plasmodium protein, unknown function [Plasmodium knowlesi strain H]|uniref:SNARE protein n=3 Tax=Plasmodium knowlesi TaxID=5850 RepID=A0A5K1UWU1_PLAKH|nr:conserved Plasmodium protein, unknown function [Plasmodium knowlesi strain H]OTN65352.1 Uncharacterized protein PKNOH_S110082500 [Plasmodium knowlesi]CAA9989447.1 conserved Plasmodium protein, unknown function [Plasmodium knowlesi strain H]SBO25080.1 conserved Plasmodium protein, unknown function [Plasmodium knowlesi strain H]SBO27826.1 conserved Plasmodium protein, unknown function [Plasmodium knowlesi strain H]VVS78921.1 conserved Plasmodium protein, unknown function [Plasmodium knowlesi |eukprot:XP_002260173.1 hypothetical protein, conserved in Plasmodium species [Plasmodium knowlesi strain H]
MKKKYSVLDDQDHTSDYDEGVRYREYKKSIRNIQINFEQWLSELKENINSYENDRLKKSAHTDCPPEFFSNNKKKINELENLYQNGVQTLDVMKIHFSQNKTYVLEISRYFSIFDKFKIQLQSLKNMFDKICVHNRINFCTQKDCSSVTYKNNEINHVIKERSALQYSISELDNIISIGHETNWKLKLQNNSITKQMKKINFLNEQIPKIHKIMKNIRYYTTRRIIILAITIASFIFLFFMLR